MIISILKWIFLALAVIYFIIAGILSRKGEEKEAIGWAKWGVIFSLMFAVMGMLESIITGTIVLPKMFGQVSIFLIFLGALMLGFVMGAIVSLRD